jgi:thiol:disulfide interchange protein
VRNIGLFLVILSMIFASGFASAENQTVSQSIQWQAYSNAPFDMARNSKHFILLYGKSKSCHWCQEMDKTTWQKASIIQTIQTNFIPVLVDVDTQLKIAAQYRITSLPTVIILDANNRIIKIFSGYFTPEIMEENLNKIIENNASLINNNQPEIIKQQESLIPITILPIELHDTLQKKQFSIFSEIEKNISDNTNNQKQQENLSIDSLEYALILFNKDEKSAHHWITTLLDSQRGLLDQTWGAIHEAPANTKNHFEIKTSLQAEALTIYSLAYRYWPDQAYRSTAEKLINYIKEYLTNPEGVFYAGQDSYAASEAQNANYYALDDQHRRQLGIPKVNNHIFAHENGLVITALTEFYMATGDNSALDKALKATRWIIDNLSIPGGGFRHEKAENNIIYLNDTLSMGNAFLELYKATQNQEYLNRAVNAAHFIDKYFQNSNNNDGFVSILDLSNTSTDKVKLTAKENADIVRLVSLLFSYTGEEFLQKMQESAFHYLMNPSVASNDLPASILMAEYRIKNHPIHITIIGSKNDVIAKNLYATALAHSPFYSRIDWWDRKEGPLLNSDTTYPVIDKSAAFVCHGFECSFPIYNPQDLLDTLHDITTPNRESMTTLGASGAKESHSPLFVNISGSNTTKNLLVNKNWFLIIFGFTFLGLLLSFTPCILPLIPIMASIIVGRTIGVEKQKTALLCLTYVLAMSFTYSLLGVLAGAFGFYFQIYMQATPVLILFSLILLALSISMLGNHELRLPHVLQQKIIHWSNLQKGGNFFGVAIMGVLSTLIVSPCVSAPLAGILSFITETSDYTLGAISLFFMSFGMGLPLLIISLFSKNILPKAARWNNQIKNFFGIILLGISIWIFSRAISNTASMMLWSAYIIFITVYMGITKRKIKNLSDKCWKTLTIMIFLYGIFLFFSALFTNSDLYQTLNMKTSSGGQSISTEPLFKNIKNQDELDQAFNGAKESHTPILLDFSAKWCTACVKMDREILNNPEVIPLLKSFLLLRVDLTSISSDSIALARQFHVVGPPIVLFFNNHGQVINLRATGELDVKQFESVLQQALDTVDN